MNKYSHIMIGELVYEHLKEEHGIHLEKDSFIRGNVIPDFSYYALVHPHFMKLSLGFVQAEVDALSHTYLKSAYIGEDYSYRLGIICHYYADFFCYAHSSGYRQAVVNHLKYEHFLHEHFVECLAAVSTIDFSSAQSACGGSDEINRQMLQAHSVYSRLEPSYDNDLVFTLRACAQTAASLVCCSRQAKDWPLAIFGEAAV